MHWCFLSSDDQPMRVRSRSNAHSIPFHPGSHSPTMSLPTPTLGLNTVIIIPSSRLLAVLVFAFNLSLLAHRRRYEIQALLLLHRENYSFQGAPSLSDCHCTHFHRFYHPDPLLSRIPRSPDSIIQLIAAN